MISLFNRSNGFVDQILRQCAFGNAVKARTSALASSINGPTFGNEAASWSRTSSQALLTAAGSGWAKMVRNTAATMSAWVLGTWASRQGLFKVVVAAWWRVDTPGVRYKRGGHG